MSSIQYVGVALLLVGATDAVLGVVLSSRAANEMQRRVLRAAFAFSAALAIAVGLVLLLRPQR
jgi:hypothetical protein